MSNTAATVGDSTITWIEISLFRQNYASKYEDFYNDIEILSHVFVEK